MWIFQSPACARGLSVWGLSPPLWPFALLEAACYCSPLQGTALPILPVLAKRRQLHVSAFSNDFTFIGIVTNSFNLEQIQVFFDFMKARKISLKVSISSYTHIFVPFFANSVPTVPARLLTQKTKHVQPCVINSVCLDLPFSGSWPCALAAVYYFNHRLL